MDDETRQVIADLRHELLTVVSQVQQQVHQQQADRPQTVANPDTSPPRSASPASAGRRAARAAGMTLPPTARSVLDPPVDVEAVAGEVADRVANALSGAMQAAMNTVAEENRWLRAQMSSLIANSTGAEVVPTNPSGDHGPPGSTP